MYRGFNLDIEFENEYYYREGLQIFNRDKKQVRTVLKDFAYDDGSLNGTEMQENWFPQIDADIFISHSHLDEKLAITLAGWLSEEFGIKAFIDSCIWGYSNELLKIIDNEYCYKPETDTYSYTQRNYSTSHIHMMLSTALSMMIDKTECLFFINTPSSISTTEIIDNTESPWIYSEISMSQIIRKRIPLRLSKRRLVKAFSEGGVLEGLEHLTIKYEVDLSHLIDLNMNSLVSWQNTYRKTIDENPLDTLYRLNNLTKLLKG